MRPHCSSLRYLPHLDGGEILRMGLKPQAECDWIETDGELRRYYQNKLHLRQFRDAEVYRAEADSIPAQCELAEELLAYLLTEQANVYRRKGGLLHCIAGDFTTPIEAQEPLWDCSLWLADDLVLMQERGGRYHLTAASLCSPSHWSLVEKFGRPLAKIHDPIPGFQQRLTPRVDRFFAQLRPGPPFVRFNWSLQADDQLAQFPGEESSVAAESLLFYRVERQTLRRLPQTGAVVFTIRVYLHALELLLAVEGALQSLLDAIDSTPPALAQYKNFPRITPALEKYRALAQSSNW